MLNNPDQNLICDVPLLIPILDENGENLCDAPLVIDLSMIDENGENLRDVPLPIDLPVTYENGQNLNSDEVITVNNKNTIQSSVVPTSSTISIREKSMNQVFNEILKWPKKQTKQRKRKVEHLPSVITADKWIEIMEAKEKDKEEEKKIRKIKREEKNREK